MPGCSQSVYSGVCTVVCQLYTVRVWQAWIQGQTDSGANGSWAGGEKTCTVRIYCTYINEKKPRHDHALMSLEFV